MFLVEFGSGESLVAKVDATGRLDIEAFMLEYLAPHLPVPRVVHADPHLLLMEQIRGTSRFSAGAEAHAAELLADLHRITGGNFGLHRDTLIGGLPQPNPRGEEWVPFFAEHRLVHMAGLALEQGNLDTATFDRVETLAGAADRFLVEPNAPSLLHGDVWSGNVLADDERITGFLDPAVYFGHREVELAFIAMFSTFGERFFAVYDEIHPIEPGFVEERQHFYNLYPNLVHVRLFGGAYLDAVQSILRRFGF